MAANTQVVIAAPAGLLTIMYDITDAGEAMSEKAGETSGHGYS
jgi:hypothetical protein